MKLERIISFAIICGMLGNFTPAIAGDDTQLDEDCFVTDWRGYDYSVHFDHSRPRNDSEAKQDYATINPSASTNCVTKMKQTLAQLKPSSKEDCLILIASADKSGNDTGYNNDALSKRRLDMVEKMLTSIKPSDCVEKWYAGASNAAVNDEYYYNWGQRAVRIIQTRKNAPKYEQIIQNLTKYESNSSSSISVIHIEFSPATQSSYDRIHDLANDMEQMESKFGKSRWKTASGNFNGARLASDSIAGVVLGTAGGLITSNVVKKNQLRGGFEDIQCTIGGQIVADYDDEFNVNIH